MTAVTIDLPVEIEQDLRAQAEARGISLEDYLQEIVSQQARATAAAESATGEVPDLLTTP